MGKIIEFLLKVVVFSVAIGLVYLVGVFAMWNFDLSEWTPTTRFLTGLIAAFCVIGVFGVNKNTFKNGATEAS